MRRPNPGAAGLAAGVLYLAVSNGPIDGAAACRRGTIFPDSGMPL